MLLSKLYMNDSHMDYQGGTSYSPTGSYFSFDQSIEGSEVMFPYGFCSYYARSDELPCPRQRD